MAKYIYMDGVDDVLRLPTMTIDKIVVDMKIQQPTQMSSIISLSYGRQAYALVYNAGSVTGVGFPTDIPFGERFVLESTFNTTTNIGATLILSAERFVPGASGEIYAVTCYLGGNVVAEYDIANGTVQDISGNGYHATLIGGTWKEDEATPLNPPEATIEELSRDRLSRVTGVNKADVLFSFDQDVEEWEVRVLGSGPGTGFLADSGGSASKGETLIAEIDDTELQQEGINRVNIYGRNKENMWTPYKIIQK